MNRQVHVFLAAIAAICLAATTSIAQVQVPLTPSSVIGGSGADNDGRPPTYPTDPATPGLWDSFDDPPSPPHSKNLAGGNATNITNGDLSEQGKSWVNTGPNPPGNWAPYVTIDLGAQYDISRIDLYNTHNRHFNNFGTDAFRIDASNTVEHVSDDVDMNLSGTVEAILSGNLSDTAGEDPVTTADSFTSITAHSEGAVRYLRFVALSGQYEGDPHRRGLNEIEVFGTLIPEPSTLVIAALGLLGVLGFTRRRGK